MQFNCICRKVWKLLTLLVNDSDSLLVLLQHSTHAVSMADWFKSFRILSISSWYNQLHSITESTVRKIHKSYSFTMQYLSRFVSYMPITPFDQICLLYYYNALGQLYKEAYIGP